MLYSILIFDEPDTRALRDQYRQRHLDYLKTFEDQTMFAGPFTTDSGSIDIGSFRLIEFPDRETALRHVEDEPYVINAVQKHWHIHRWETSLPYTWRDCPRVIGNIQVMFHALDKPDSQNLRNQITPANLAYLEERRNQVMSRGPLLADDGETRVGSVFLLDVANMEMAHEFKDNMPFFKQGLYQNIIFHRWRFGRTFDKLKA